MKSFDFPIVFNYVVGCLSISKQLPRKDPPPFREHITQLPEMHLTPCKQFLFSKKKLIDIQPQVISAKKRDTQSSGLSSNRNTINKEFMLRKIKSHRTHLQETNNQNVNADSLKSLKSIQKVVDSNEITNFQSIKLDKKGTFNFIKEKKQKKRIRFDDDKENFIIDSKQSISQLPSNVSIGMTGSKQSFGSRRNLGRLKTEMDPEPNRFTNKRIMSVKRVTKMKKTLIAIKLGHTQKQQTESNGEKEKSDRKIRSIKKLTFRDLEKEEQSFKHVKSKMTIRSGSKKTIFSKNTISKKKKGTHQQFQESSHGNPTENQIQSKCSINARDSKLDNNLPNQLQVQKQDYLRMKTEHIIKDEEDDIKDELKNKYKIKTERFIDLNSENNKIEEDDMKQSKYIKFYPKRVGDKTHVKPYKNKNSKEQTVLAPNNKIKVAKRVKKASYDAAGMHQVDEELNASDGRFKDRNYFMKSNFSKTKNDTANAFTELNIFHKMIKEYEGLFEDDKTEQENPKEVIPNKPFAMMSQEVDKRDSNSYEVRKQQFEFEDLMIKFGKRIVNKTNELKQVNCA